MKLYFLTAAQSALADRDPAILDAIRSLLLARPDIEEASSPADADAIVIHEAASFKEWRYIKTLLAEPVIGKYPHKVYTINVEDGATGLLRGIYCALPRNRMAPGVHKSVPYALTPNEFILTGADQPHPPARYLATWRGNPKSRVKLRGRLLALYGGSSQLLVESTGSWMNHGPDEKRHYVDLMQSGHFALCPAGWADATFRVYESMTLGIAPVLIADQYVPPDGPDWERLSIRVAEKDLPELEQRLRERLPEAVELGRRAREAWLQYFSPDKTMAYYADALLDCIRSGQGKGSPAEEVQRWRSWKTYWSNEWTLPQRVKIKLRRLLSRSAG